MVVMTAAVKALRSAAYSAAYLVDKKVVMLVDVLVATKVGLMADATVAS